LEIRRATKNARSWKRPMVVAPATTCRRADGWWSLVAGLVLQFGGISRCAVDACPSPDVWFSSFLIRFCCFSRHLLGWSYYLQK